MTIYLGHSLAEKQGIVTAYCSEHDIRSVVVIAPDRFPLPITGADHVRFADVIMYVTFYRLLQKIDPNTLVVLHECLRTQNRYDLSYNCIRNYLNQTSHVLIFQTLPQIDEADDFMILFDFATQSRWKRMRFDPDFVREHSQVHVHPWPLDFQRINVPTSPATRKRYDAERERLFGSIGAKDPHTLPRNLYLIGGKDKLAYIIAHTPANPTLFDEEMAYPPPYVARNRRLSHDRIVTYDDAKPDGGPYTVFEFPHRFIDWCDFVAHTGQAASDVLVADLKVDNWYFDRYTAWKERIHATYASLRR